MKGLFWIIRNPDGGVFPHSFALRKPLCIRRFIHAPTYGYGGTWPMWQAKGFQCVQCTLQFINTPKEKS